VVGFFMEAALSGFDPSGFTLLALIWIDLFRKTGSIFSFLTKDALHPMIDRDAHTTHSIIVAQTSLSDKSTFLDYAAFLH